MTKLLIAAFFAALSIAPASAGPISLHLTAEQKTETAGADGKPVTAWTVLGTKRPVHPGDILRYRVSAANTGIVSVSGLVVTQPVPPGTRYVPHSGEQTLLPTYSLDGRSFTARPVISSPAGPVPAAPETYTALRWRIPTLPAHASTEVVYLVRVR